MSDRDPRPPFVGRWLLRARPLGPRRAEVEADLHELFLERAAREGRTRAALRYCADVLSLWAWQPAGGRWASGVWQDLVHAQRVFRRNPGSVAVAVAGLALAIAVSTTVFSLLNVTLFRPAGVSDPSSVVRALRATKGGVSTSWVFGEYLDLRDHARGYLVEAVLRDVARFSATPASATDEHARPVSMHFVGGTYHATFGADALLGRVLTPADDVIGAPAVVVVNYTFWTRQLGADPTIVGRPLWINGVPATVAGVAARAFTGLGDTPPAFWAPLASYHVLYSGSPLTQSSQIGVDVYGRIASGQTLAQSQAALGAIAASLPRRSPGEEPAAGVRLDPASSRFVHPDEVRTLTLVVAVVMLVIGLVLMLACVNVANLQLATALSRHREIGVRLAVGASRGRVIRQLLTESVALGVVAGACALALTWWFLPLLVAAVRLPQTVDVAPDLRVYLFLAAISFAAGLGAGLAPARHGTRGDLVTPLKGESAPSRGSRPGRLRSTLIGVQAGASIILLVLSALLTRAMVRATQVDIGFDARPLVTVTADFGRERYDRRTAGVYWAQVLDRIRAIDTVQSASLSYFLPYGDGQHVRIVTRDGRRHTTFVHNTDAHYFSTIGLRLVRGRIYTAQEVSANAPVVVLSESLAKEYWPGVDPVGATLEAYDGDTGYTVIGIVADAITARLREMGSAALYRPIENPRDARLVIRTRGSPDALVPALRDAIQPIDPRVRLDLGLVSAGLERQLEEPRILASLAGTLAVLALGLAVVGVYGVTAFVTGQRSREIGLRIAVGASGGDIMRLLLVDSLRPVLIGLAGGTVAALLVSRVFAGILYGVGTYDPIAFGAAAVVLLLSAAAAVYVPTRRAARLDPAFVLRQT